MNKIYISFVVITIFHTAFADPVYVDAAGFEYSMPAEHTYQRVDEEYPPKVIKLKKRPGSPHSFATVYVAKERLGDFLLDTGATCVVMTPDMIERVPTPNKRFLGTTNTMTANGPAIAEVYILNRLRVGEAILDNVEVFVMDNVSGGLIGMSFLAALGDISIKKRGTELHYSN